jgi:Flp pilus assembly protein protease CpaA
MNQKYALLAITLGLLLAGWMDGQDAKLMEAKPITVACVSCAGGVR